MASTMAFAGEQVVAGSSPHEPGFLQAETICFIRIGLVTFAMTQMKSPGRAQHCVSFGSNTELCNSRSGLERRMLMHFDAFS